MKRITFKHYGKVPVIYTGWLFTFAGLRLVAYHPDYRSDVWSVAEYSTGFGISKYESKTRKRAVKNVQDKLTLHGSFEICRVMAQTIYEHGILNS